MSCVSSPLWDLLRDLLWDHENNDSYPSKRDSQTRAGWTQFLLGNRGSRMLCGCLQSFPASHEIGKNITDSCSTKSALPQTLAQQRLLEEHCGKMANQTTESGDSSEKQHSSVEQHEHAVDSHGNLVYENAEEEPELHARTYLALAAMFFLNLVQVLALQGPPAVVCTSGLSIASCLPR